MSKLNRWLLVLVWMAVIWWLSNQPSLSSGLKQDFLLRKLAHVSEYAILMWLVVRALGADLKRARYLLPALVIAIGYAGIDEWHQTWVEGRIGSVRDVLIDSIGILIVLVLIWWRRKKRR